MYAVGATNNNMDNLRQPDVITVAITRVDGGVTVMRVVVNEYAPNPENPSVRMLVRHYEPTPEYIQSLIDKHIEGGNWTGGLLPVSWRIVDNDYAENEDRYFRNAWKDNAGKKVEVDMPKAREIHKHQLRELRQPLLESLDVEYTRADESKDNTKKAEIVAKKQELRDLTADPRIEAATTPEELKTIGLDKLK